MAWKAPWAVLGVVALSSALQAPTRPLRVMRLHGAPQRDTAELKKCLEREYRSFFDPMEMEYYNPEVEFKDPLTSFRGMGKYKDNVDLLAGRTLLGSFLFQDAGIDLHSVEDLGPGRVRTRWTLWLTARVLPWRPRAEFTGVSDYTLDVDGKVLKQQDFWDSINLEQGEYVRKDTLTGVLDFLRQLRPQGSTDDLPRFRLPLSLLRRGKGYDVRRVPPFMALSTPAASISDYRAAGKFDSYTSGQNVEAVAVQCLDPLVFSPSQSRLLRPLHFTQSSSSATSGVLEAAESISSQKAPQPSSPDVALTPADYGVVAVAQIPEGPQEGGAPSFSDFEAAAMTLEEQCKSDGLEVSQDGWMLVAFRASASGGSDGGGSSSGHQVARFEIWRSLKSHLWG